LPDDILVDSFTEFVKQTEPRLRHALSALFGTELGKEMAAESLAYGWEHWDRIREMDNPPGYLYTVGRDRGRRLNARNRPVLAPVDIQRLPWIEPQLAGALAQLPERQRVVVMLLHSFQWSMSEVGDLLGMSKSTVHTHSQRGLNRLRKQMGVEL
jgi:DNA-directed RNA polymerase specialized sigma24 family protein